MPTLAVGMLASFPVPQHAHGKRGHGTLLGRPAVAQSEFTASAGAPTVGRSWQTTINMDTADDNALDRYARQMRFPAVGAAGQERLRQSRALVCGCGALGGAAANALVRAGVGGVRIVDRNVVEWTNLQRQVLFDEGDARDGLPKAVAAAPKSSAPPIPRSPSSRSSPTWTRETSCGCARAWTCSSTARTISRRGSC